MPFELVPPGTHIDFIGKRRIAVTLSVANPAASLPVAYRLYLPENWAADPIRRSKARVPDDPALRPHPRYLAWHRRERFKA